MTLFLLSKAVGKVSQVAKALIALTVKYGHQCLKLLTPRKAEKCLPGVNQSQYGQPKSLDHFAGSICLPTCSDMYCFEG